MKALIDADTVAFAPAASAEGQEEWVAIARTKEMVERILLAVNATEYQLFLTGPNNFRYSIYPEYKASRVNAYRPTHEPACRQYLLDEWGAVLVDGYEADDAVGIAQMEAAAKAASFDTTIICHMDKDINMIPGWHYNWPLSREGKLIRDEIKYFVTYEEAFRNFCYQLLIGDPTDNIKGVVGIGPVKANAFLDTTPKEKWIEEIKNLYSCEEEFDLNARCLWICRSVPSESSFLNDLDRSP